MNTPKIRTELKTRLDFDNEILELVDDHVSLKLELAAQSQIIAALVLEHGGAVTAAHWDAAHANLSKFIPYVIGRDGNNVMVEVAIQPPVLCPEAIT